MKLSTLLSTHTDHELPAEVRGETVTVGWHQPDHLELVKASKATSAMSSASAEGVLKRGLWLEELPHHVDLPGELGPVLSDFVDAHYGIGQEEAEERDTLLPPTPEKLRPILQRYRALNPEPTIQFSEEGYGALCRVVCDWITEVRPLLDDQDNQVEWAKLTVAQKMQIVRVLPQSLIMEILTQSFKEQSLDDDVKND